MEIEDEDKRRCGSKRDLHLRKLSKYPSEKGGIESPRREKQVLATFSGVREPGRSVPSFRARTRLDASLSLSPTSTLSV